MKKKLVSMLLVGTMVAGMFAGCGGSDNGSASDAGTNADASEASDAGDADSGTADEGSDAAEAPAGDEGKVINIYSWNNEFKERVEAVYPEVQETSSDGTVTTLKDGTEIHWIVNPNQDGVYQQKLDEALMNQADAAADDKIDMFLSETDYVFKYTDAEADVAMPLKDLGIDPDKDLSDQDRKSVV